MKHETQTKETAMKTDVQYTIERVEARLANEGGFVARLASNRCAVYVKSVWGGKVRFEYAMTSRTGETHIENIIEF